MTNWLVMKIYNSDNKIMFFKHVYLPKKYGIFYKKMETTNVRMLENLNIFVIRY